MDTESKEVCALAEDLYLTYPSRWNRYATSYGIDKDTSRRSAGSHERSWSKEQLGHRF
jgi:hypothetical protein